jgi:hypothetical protein
MLFQVDDSSAWGCVVNHRRIRHSGWQEQVVAKASFLEYDRDRLLLRCPERHDQMRKATTRRLDDARCAAGGLGNGAGGHNTWMARLANIWTGHLIEGAFANLHIVEVALVDLYADEDIRARAPGVLARMRVCLPPTDQRRLQAEALFAGEADSAPPGTVPSLNGGHGIVPRTMRRQQSVAVTNGASHEFCRRRAALREAMKVSYEAADERHARVRRLRNVLFVAALVLSALVGAVCLVGFWNHTAIPLCFSPEGGDSVCPSTPGGTPDTGDVSIVALMGVLGGAMSATFAIQRLGSTSTPYAIPVTLSFLKLPAGALSAIGGLVLIHGQFVPGLSDLDSQGQILAYAIVLGVAQQLVTRSVDKKAEDVLAAVPNKGRTATDVQPPAADPSDGGGDAWAVRKTEWWRSDSTSTV